MEELIYSVHDIFTNYLSKQGRDFYNIPEYQRGYKWTAASVTQLLDDTLAFGNSKSSEDEFYCLQNVTLTRKISSGGMPCMEVIDGQQRITTLFVLLSFLQRKFAEKIIRTDSHILKYSVREQTDEFLHSDVQSGKIWDSPIDPDKALFKDQYYIMEAAKAIQEWFDRNSGARLEDIILKDVKLIVNVVDSEDGETAFAGLNGGKVDLDGADLMRAVLITRAAKQRYPKEKTSAVITQKIGGEVAFNIDISMSSQGKVNEYRVKLGQEIDGMWRWWSDTDVREYFIQLLPNRITQNRSFKVSEYPIGLLYFAFFEAYKTSVFREQEEKDLDLSHFENGIDFNNRPDDDHLELYNKLKEFHMTLVDWYNTDEIYNLAGYLMYNFKSASVSFGLLWKMWESCHTKSEFIKGLKRLIRYQLAFGFAGATSDVSLEGIFRGDDERYLNGAKWKENDETYPLRDALIELRKSILDTSGSDWYNNDFTVKLLPVLDILPFTMKAGEKSKKVIKRESQRYLRRVSAEDKEHVRSQKRAVGENNMAEEDRTALEEENRRGLNSIGNIVLLHKSVNRSYRNEELALKMIRIYSEHIQDDKGAFIRPHSFNVFMSKLRNTEGNGIENDELYWSAEDIKRTTQEIDKRLSEYFVLPDIPKEAQEA